MDATYSNILADLKNRLGSDAFLLSPEDIAPIIKKSVEVQANMRYLKTFPLPVRKIGSSVFICINHLAEWMATGKCDAAEIEDDNTSAAPVKTLPRKSAPKQGKYDRHLGFTTEWRDRIAFQIQLLDAMEAIVLREGTPDEGLKKAPPRPYP